MLFRKKLEQEGMEDWKEETFILVGEELIKQEGVVENACDNQKGDK